MILYQDKKNELTRRATLVSAVNSPLPPGISDLDAVIAFLENVLQNDAFDFPPRLAEDKK